MHCMTGCIGMNNLPKKLSSKKRWWEHWIRIVSWYKIISKQKFEWLKRREKEAKKYLHEVVELRKRIHFLETEFLKRHKPSDLLGVVFEHDICPYFSNRVAIAHTPNLPRGTCMKYGSYGHIELQLPWGMSQCTLKNADTCPIFSHGMPCVNGIEDGKKPYGSMWWGNIKGEEEEIIDWNKQVFQRVHHWLKMNKYVGMKNE